MEVKPEFVAPCGLYCGVCAVWYATRDDNPKFKQALVGVYRGNLPGSDGLTADDIHCQGCLSDEPFFFCRECRIKDCVQSKGYASCRECDEFPCQLIKDFPLPIGKKVILRAIPQWRELGTEKWVEQEEARYRCPNCGTQLFRGAKRCNNCKVQVDLD